MVFAILPQIKKDIAPVLQHQACGIRVAGGCSATREGASPPSRRSSDLAPRLIDALQSARHEVVEGNPA
jgi:hypothetical protein